MAKQNPLHEMIWEAARRVGLSAPRIADEIGSVAFPDTWSGAQKDGGERVVRLGLIEIIKPILKVANDDDGQMDLGDIDPSFAVLVRPLRSNTYTVPSLQCRVPLSRLIAEPALLDEARAFMRQKGLECLEEAERLDQLAAAVHAQVAA